MHAMPHITKDITMAIVGCQPTGREELLTRLLLIPPSFHCAELDLLQQLDGALKVIHRQTYRLLLRRLAL